MIRRRPGPGHWFKLVACAAVSTDFSFLVGSRISLGAATAPVATLVATPTAPAVNVPSDSIEASLGLGERLALRQALPDRADDFAAGEFAVVGEVAGGHSGQINHLHSALLQDRAVRLLVRVERAKPGRVSSEKA